MTQHRDIERVLDQWLSEGPTRVPDRVFDDAVRVVYRTPQRSHWRRLWRDLKLSTRLLTATTAVVAIAAVAGIGIVAFRPSQSGGITPPASAPATHLPATPTDDSALCQPSDPACRGRLAPGTHATDQLLIRARFTVPAGWRKDMDIEGVLGLSQADEQGASIAAWPDLRAASQTSCSGEPEPAVGRRSADLAGSLAGRPGLTTTSPEAVTLGELSGLTVDVSVPPDGAGGPCPGQLLLFTDAGTIDDGNTLAISAGQWARFWFLEAGDGHVLTLAIVVDDATSADAFLAAATPVVESFRFERQADCVDASRCLGDLAPGSYPASGLRVPLTYVVPDGWRNQFATEWGHALQPQAESLFGTGLFVFLDVEAISQACGRDPEPGVGHTAEELATWVAGLPGLTATDREPVSAGGLEGVAYDVARGEGARLCSGEAKLFRSDGTLLSWGISEGFRERHILLDTPSGGNVLIAIAGPETGFDALTAAATPVIASFEFRP